LAVNLRLLRAMGDIAATTGRDDVHAMLRERAKRLVERATDSMLESDGARLRDRLRRLEQVLNG
jgi:predicted ArsR family transcriptional regulator